MAYLDVLDRAWPPDKPEPITFIVIPEYVAQPLVGADPLQPVRPAAATVLLGRPHTVVVDVPYRRDEPRSSEWASPMPSRTRAESMPAMTPTPVATDGLGLGPVVS